ncbi:uncharacterized protein LOC125506615 [Triticum urartu]|uniref:uncharacterized protein LOC125506615 n=1 Tax=Triticum urartu TaxID=4572 RepID=UPI00204464C4|nr:uncharacterized protein LOC125506615 [Triticum urartu]
MAADTAAATRSPEERSKTTGGADVQDEERDAKKMRTTLATEEDDGNGGDEELEISSPLREPYLPKEVDMRANPHILAAYKLAQDKFHDKRDREEKLLPTRLSFLFGASPVLVPDAGKKAALSAARSIVHLSSSLGGDPLAQSTGFWIDWDEGSKTGIVLTTAHLIRANKLLAKDYWAKKDRYQYHPGAQVTAHLLDDTTVEGRLLYHQEHYDLAFLKIAMDRSVQVASFADTFNSGQQALQLGRDGNLILRITLGKVTQGDFVYFCRDKKYESDDGGEPVIDFDGKVVGMINDCKHGFFVPFFILNRCMELWRNSGCIPRPHLGLKFKALKFLNPSYVEYILRKLDIDDGLLVEEVSMGSHAEKVGIRVGDIIGSIDGESISTRIELEKKLLSISMGSFHGGNDITTKVEISVRVFHTNNRLWREKHLNVNISDHREVVERGRSPLSDRRTRTSPSCCVYAVVVEPKRLARHQVTVQQRLAVTRQGQTTERARRRATPAQARLVQGRRGRHLPMPAQEKLVRARPGLWTPVVRQPPRVVQREACMAHALHQASRQVQPTPPVHPIIQDELHDPCLQHD